MDAPEDPTPVPNFGVPASAEDTSAAENRAAEQGTLDGGPFQELEQPLETVMSGEHDPAKSESSAEDSGGGEPLAQHILPLAEASYLAGVSVQALRQRIKRGTLPGAEAIDSRGQSVAGIKVQDLQLAFPQRCFDTAGASRSNAADSPGAAAGSAPFRDGEFLFGAATHPAWEPQLRPRGSDDRWDPQADLERGGMAPPPPTGRVPQIDPSGFPAARGQSTQGFGVGLWGIALIVALAAVGVAGLLTGAREAQAASRRLDMSYQREVLLLEQLKGARKERDLAQARAESLAQELRDLGRLDPDSGQ